MSQRYNGNIKAKAVRYSVRDLKIFRKILQRERERASERARERERGERGERETETAVGVT